MPNLTWGKERTPLSNMLMEIEAKNLLLTSITLNEVNIVANANNNTKNANQVIQSEINGNIAHNTKVSIQHTNLENNAENFTYEDTPSSHSSEFAYSWQVENEQAKQLAIIPPIPAVVQHDIDFLRESWANMGKFDQVENDPNKHFQLVVPRKKKKQQKQFVEGSNRNYSTWLRVSTSKSFQMKNFFFFFFLGCWSMPPSNHTLFFFLLIYVLDVAACDPSTPHLLLKKRSI